MRIDNQINPFCIDSNVLSLITDTVASQYEILPVAQSETDETKAITFLYGSNILKSKAENLLTVQFPNHLIIWQEFDQESLKKIIKTHYFEGLAFEEKAARIVREKISQIKEEFTTKEKPILAFDYSGEVPGRDANKAREIISNVICRADQMGATDININNNLVLLPNGVVRSELLIWTRVDGVFKELHRDEMPKSPYEAIPLVLKLLAQLNTVTHKEEVTGIIKATLQYGKELVPVQLRVQFMPCGTDRGIGVCIRIQKTFNFDFNLESIGLSAYQIKLIQQFVIESVHGCTFISGSINRGKNCTLVTLLQSIQRFNKERQQSRHIILLEDPPEFILDSISQITLPKDKTFSQMQKHLLRYNPDIIAIGEVRDEDDSAKMVSDLSIIGHPVLTTIHADTACDVPFRLINLGVPRYKIAESLNVIISQILVRKCCQHCTKETDVFPVIEKFHHYLDKLGIPRDTEFLRSSGLVDGSKCRECGGTGLKGRTGVFEVLPVSEEIKEMIIRENTTSFQLRRQALKEGFETIWHNGLRKVIVGEIALSELLRHIPRPTERLEGLDMVTDFNSSQELSLDFSN